MVINEDSHVVGIRYGAVGEGGSGAHTMYVHTRPTERGVCKVAVVDGRGTILRNMNAVVFHIGSVIRCFKLHNK